MRFYILHDIVDGIKISTPNKLHYGQATNIFTSCFS